MCPFAPHNYANESSNVTLTSVRGKDRRKQKQTSHLLYKRERANLSTRCSHWTLFCIKKGRKKHQGHGQAHQITLDRDYFMLEGSRIIITPSDAFIWFPKFKGDGVLFQFPNGSPCTRVITVFVFKCLRKPDVIWPKFVSFLKSNHTQKGKEFSLYQKLLILLVFIYDDISCHPLLSFPLWPHSTPSLSQFHPSFRLSQHDCTLNEIPLFKWPTL